MMMRIRVAPPIERRSRCLLGRDTLIRAIGFRVWVLPTGNYRRDVGS